MKKITLTRNGQTSPRDVEVSTMHADGLVVGQGVMLRIPHDEPAGEEEKSEERKENSNAEKILKETAKRVFAAFKELADCSEILDEITPPVKLSIDDPYTDTTSDLAEFLNDSLRELDLAKDALRPWVQEVQA